MRAGKPNFGKGKKPRFLSREHLHHPTNPRNSPKPIKMHKEHANKPKPKPTKHEENYY
jgi:hypothetical protein